MTTRNDESRSRLSRRLRELEAELISLRADVRTSDEPIVDAGDPELRARFEAVAGELQALLATTTGGHGAIDTRSSGSITPLDPDPDDIDLADAAHALSNLSRFAGQGIGFYSVARHAVHVSREVEVRGGCREARQWGLLHDVSEAYLADVPAPVKRSLPGYTHAERRLQAAVREAFGVELAAADGRLVDAVDDAVGRYELSLHFPDRGREAPPLEYDPSAIEPAGFESNAGAADAEDATDAKSLFLDRARELGLD